ncbi:putative holin-like toxin [Bacillus spongiae]|uniref:Holin-like toxin n=1 Tax=Bacillus spongiae TaxID=2683610 RepID=A0ABU8HBB7_9BACI
MVTVSEMLNVMIGFSSFIVALITLIVTIIVLITKK